MAAWHAVRVESQDGDGELRRDWRGNPFNPFTHHIQRQIGKGITLDIEELRKRINELDADIVGLLNERTQIALEVGQIKKEQDAPMFAPHREEQVFNRVKELNTGPLPAAAIETIYREIVSVCRALEKPFDVAFLGPEGSFGHVAARKYFGNATAYLPIQQQTDIFTEVETGRADYGVVAIENSTDGVVRDIQDMFMKSSLKICAEVLMPVSHHLLSRSTLDQVTQIYSHRQAFAQCRGWLRDHVPQAEMIHLSSTSEAAMYASQHSDAAAIASKLAAELYELKIVAANIADDPGNTTRFIVLSHHDSQPTGNDKTSLLFAVKHESGALLRVLECFHRYGLNLSKIESRPSRNKAWEYVFFVDVEGHREEEAVQIAVQDAEEACTLIKHLGSYPSAS